MRCSTWVWCRLQPVQSPSKTSPALVLSLLANWRLPLLNTVLADKLRESSLLLNWTSFDVAFATTAEWTSAGRMVSSDAVLSPGSVAKATFSQRRSDGRSFATVVGVVPFIFDSAVPFCVSFSSPGGTVVVAFQHTLRFRINSGLGGRMKALGFSLDDPSAWAAPQRVPFQRSLATTRDACYIGGAWPEGGLVASR